MKESRKIWKAAGRFAQYYCAVFFAGFLLFFMAFTADAASPTPDPLLNPPMPCAEGVVAADLSNGLDIYGRPIALPAPPQPSFKLASGLVIMPVRAPTGRRLDLTLDISGLLQPTGPACLTPEQARQNMPPKAVPKR